MSPGNTKMTESKSAEVEYAAEKGMEHSEHQIPDTEPSFHLITSDTETGHSGTTHVQQAGNTARSEGRTVDCQGQENPHNTQNELLWPLL